MFNLHALKYALLQIYCCTNTFLLCLIMFLHCISICTYVTVKSSFLSFWNSKLHFTSTYTLSFDALILLSS